MQGLQLTDKEFLPPLTVRVTAAVYCVLDLQLSPQNLSQQHWADVSPNTSSFDFAETCVLVNSRLGLLSATYFHRPRFTSYVCICRVHNARVISSALDFLIPPTQLSGLRYGRTKTNVETLSWHRDYARFLASP